MSDFDEPYLNARQLLSWVYLRDHSLIHVADRVTGRSDPRLTIELYATYAAREGDIKTFEKSDDAEKDILRKLLDERANFVAIGKCKQETCHSIPILEWVNRDIDYARGTSVEKNRVIYSDLMFSSTQAFRVWPEVEPLWPEIDLTGEPTVEIEVQGSATGATLSSGGTTSGVGRKRGAYRVPLEEWLEPWDIKKLRRISPAALAAGFREHCEQHRPDVLELLPRRNRSMEPLIERIIKRRLAFAKAQKAAKGQ